MKKFPTSRLDRWRAAALRLAAGLCLSLLAGCGGGFYACFTTGDIRCGFVAVGVAPTITTQPASQSVAVGGTATFFVTATGSEPLSYQWMRDSVNIGGATQSNYTTAHTTAADNGASFAVVVSNAFGKVTSSPAMLIVM